MLPTSFKDSNFTYTKPKGWEDDQCMDLPVWKGNVPIDDAGNYVPSIVSCWKLSLEDLNRINETGCIWLSITGNGMPPVSLFTEHPFE